MKSRRPKKDNEQSFWNHWKLLYPNLPVPERQYRFCPTRKWAADFAWPQEMIIVELHGGGYRGRHSSVKGQAGDLEKSNAAQAMGWRVLAYNVVAMRDMAAVCDQVAEVLTEGTRRPAGDD